MLDRNIDPTAAQLRSFTWMLFGFAAVLGAITWYRGEALIGAAWFTGTAWAISMVLNGSSSRLIQLRGAMIPALLYGLGALPSHGVTHLATALAAAGLFVFVGLIAAASVTARRSLYVGWLSAGEPIGWTVSHIILAILYYLVFTPIGLLMRLLGQDPLTKKPDQSPSYWTQRERRRRVESYFRQF